MAVPSGTGLVAVIGPQQLADEHKRLAEQSQASPVIQGLAGYVRRCFTAAENAKRESLEERLLKCIRQRRGEYDPDVLAEIRKSGGSEIYMMLTSNKCRAAASWIKDVMQGTRDQVPWDIEPTSEPDLSPMDMQSVVQRATEEAMHIEMQAGGTALITFEGMRDVITRIKDQTLTEMRERAEAIIKRTRSKMEDQLQEGGFYEALDEFIDDLVTFPFAIIKGPVPRNRKALAWVPGQDGQFELDVQDKIQLEWERVDPFMIYWAPHATDIDDGYMIERHKLTRIDLEALIGVEGYDDNAIKSVLDDYGRGGLNNWLYVDAAKAQAEGKSLAAMYQDAEPTIDALQYWGSVQGKMLVEWGMEAESVPDQTRSYSAEVWVIGPYVIKATLNADPLGRKPYYKTSYEVIPGSWAGNGVADLVRDTQAMCNAAARALSNNMGIASGPMAFVNVDRLPSGEPVNQMYPWRIFQTTSDPYGSTADPVKFFNADSHAQELMIIYEKFSQLADEYSGVPRYMTGDSPAGGAGRTASGMSMLMNNAGKSIKQVIGNIDMDITRPLIERLYYYNMRYADDPDLKGDLRVVARGVNVLVAKEEAQVRMNEILNIVATNPMFIEIVGEEAIADLLREVCKPLNMDIVPPKEVIRARVLAKQQLMMMQQMLEAQAMGQPDATVNFDRDSEGAVTGARVMPKQKQRLIGGGKVTDNFAPARR